MEIDCLLNADELVLCGESEDDLKMMAGCYYYYYWGSTLQQAALQALYHCGRQSHIKDQT